MLLTRIIPCLDIRDGRVVKGVRFHEIKDAGSPPELAERYEKEGADEIVLLDISATPEGRKTQLDVVERVRERIALPLTIGGGVRDIDSATALLDAGADKISVNTAAVMRPSLLGELADRFGCQCVVLALDAKKRESGAAWEVVVESGKKKTGLDAVEWARVAVRMGAGEILLTSWDRDGTKGGYDLELITAVSNAVNVPVIASGGAAKPEDMALAVKAGASAVLAASIFHYGEYTVSELKKELAKTGVEVRR
ncbi:MAG: imidazole glycerol phosphate synthase subunit HisF [Myxococcota bacterium]